MTLREVFERHHQSTLAHAATTLTDMRRFLTWWEELTGDLPVEAIGRAELRQFLQAAASLHYLSPRRRISRHTVRKWYRYVSALLHTAYAEELLDRLPRFPSMGKLPTAVPVYPTMAQVEAIYRQAPGATWPPREHADLDPPLWWQTLIVYLYNVGSRRGEWWNSLRCDAVDLGRRLIVLTDHKDGGDVEIKAINETLADHLARFLSDRALLFPSPHTRRRLYGQWHALQEAAGITVPRPAGAREGPWFGFHELRKTCGTLLCAINPRAAQVTLGHKSIATTLAHYAGVDETLRRATAELPQPAAFVLDPTFRVVG